MRIIITGSAGFIGFHLAKRLLERGDTVIGIDNLNDYYSIEFKEKRNALLKKYKNYSFYKVDIANYDELKKAFSKCDCVIHLAAQAGVRYSITNPHVYGKSNLTGFLNILELCREFKPKNFVFASSSSVYGNCKETPFKEDSKLDTPISLYAATKKADELMAYTYSHLYGLKCIGFRFFTVYGPWGRPDMAPFLFTDKIARKEIIEVYNNGNMKRDFTYVDDIVSGVIFAIGKEYSYEIINLARGESINLMDFISEIETSLGVKAKINFLPLQAGDVVETFADVSKAARMLGYKPKTNIKEGVKNLVAWYNEYCGIK